MVTQLNNDAALSPSQQRVQSAIRKHCAEFDEEYWREKDRESEYQDDDLVLSLERTPMVLKREYANPSVTQPPGWPDDVGTQPGEVE